MTGPPPAPVAEAPARTGILHRLAGFGGLPLIALITPLLVLPVFARAAGQSGWASAVTGESLGQLAGMFVSYGWYTVGPARIALERGPSQRARYYRESLVVRLSALLCVIPFLAVACALLANHGFVLLTFLMALTNAAVPLSFSWFAVGTSAPGSIALFEVLPRVAAAAVSTAIILVSGWLLVYPLLSLAVPLTAMGWYSRRLLRANPGPWPRPGELPRLLVRDRAAALNDAATGAYATVAVPVVNSVSPAGPASSYASADKLLRFGQFVPGTLANAFQSWTVEDGPEHVRGRLRIALGAHLGLGVAGLVVLGVGGPVASSLLFGADVAATHAVCFLLGLAFILYSVRTGVSRLVLFPARLPRVVLRSTAAGGLVGLPAVIVLTKVVGPWGASAALLLSEVVTFAVLLGPTRRVLRSHAEAAA